MDLCLQRKVNRDELNEVELRLLASQKNMITSTVQSTIMNYISKKKYMPQDGGNASDGNSIDMATMLSSLSANNHHPNNEMKEMVHEMERKIQASKEEIMMLFKREGVKAEDNVRTSVQEITTMVVRYIVL